MQFNQNSLENWLEESLAKNRLDQNSSFEQLSKLTIIIPSYGRHSFLLRQTAYWGYSSANIIIIDGSPDPLTDRMCKALAGLPNFRYLHVKDGFINRLKLASKYIQTPYAVLLSDDEFLLKGALCSAIARLEENSELIACNGQVVGFSRPEASGAISYHDTGYTFWKYEILEDNAQDRLAHAFATYNAATCYAVLRRDVWVSSWGSTQVWSSAHTIEPYQTIATYLYGKLTTVDEIYMLRSTENKPFSSMQSFNKKLSFEEWWFTPRYTSEREDFISRLAAIAIARSGLNGEEARQAIKDAVAGYFALCEKRKKGALLRSIRNITRATISKTLRRIMPPSAFQQLRLCVIKLVGANHQGGANENMYSWQMFSRSSNAVNNQVEIQGIESLVVEFYEALTKSKIVR